MILKLIPVFQERIWGGDKLASRFNYLLPSKNIGECWGISAHENGMSIIEDGAYTGQSLNELWKHERHLFGNYHAEEFPLLVKILDAEDDLSVQVHPNNEQAQEMENVTYGKTECWYVVEAEDGAEIILGHEAKTKAEMKQKIENGEWERLLTRQSIKAGDFIFVPSGTVHAIGKGIVILETQQSSDTTYRLYDFERKDDSGHMRELHVDQAIAVTQVPHQPSIVNTKLNQIKEGRIQTLVQVPEFNVYHVRASTGFEIKPINRFRALTILSGTGWVDQQPVKMGDHLILTAHTMAVVEGELEWVMSDVNTDE